MMPIGVMMIDPKTSNITYASPEMIKQAEDMDKEDECGTGGSNGE